MSDDLDLEAIKGRLDKIEKARSDLDNAHQNKFGSIEHRIADDTLHGLVRNLAADAEMEYPALIAAYEAKCDEVERLQFFNEGIGKEIDELRDENEALKKAWRPRETAEALPAVDLETVLPERMQRPGMCFYLQFGQEIMKVTLP